MVEIDSLHSPIFPCLGKVASKCPEMAEIMENRSYLPLFYCFEPAECSNERSDMIGLERPRCARPNTFFKIHAGWVLDAAMFVWCTHPEKTCCNWLVESSLRSLKCLLKSEEPFSLPTYLRNKARSQFPFE